MVISNNLEDIRTEMRKSEDHTVTVLHLIYNFMLVTLFNQIFQLILFSVVLWYLTIMLKLKIINKFKNILNNLFPSLIILEKNNLSKLWLIF